MTYESAPNYDDAAYDGLAMHCSDGRFSRQFNDFIVSHLGLVRCDRLIVPGGPGVIGGRPDAEPDGQRVLGELTFLCEAHEIDRVVLIQHDLCMYYHAKLGATDETLRAMQLEDLACAREVVVGATGIDRVEMYIARVVGRVVVFEPARVG